MLQTIIADIIGHFRFSHPLFLKVKERVNQSLISVSLDSWYSGRVTLPPETYN